jgi:uncharacterized protein YndB with AHSA1/START domain
VKEAVMSKKSSTTTALGVPADTVFATITDIARLPDWNAIMTRVVEGPTHREPGAEWVVEFHALGTKWRSRSRVEEIDADARRFAYRAATDDGNPSYAIWRWEVVDAGGGCEVRVSWELNPVTFWRRNLLVHIRSRQLRRQEVPGSLAALAQAAATRV